jgi:hypothetical protein
MSKKNNFVPNTGGGTNIVGLIIMAFVAIVVVFQLVPTLVSSNSTVQASSAQSITKLAANMGEWLLPLGAIVLGGWLLLKRIR